MKYTYISNFSLYKAAMRTYVRSSNRRRFWFHFQMWGMLVLGLILAIIALLNGMRVSTLLLPLCAGLVAGGIVAPILRPWNLRRCYKVSCGEKENRLVYVAIEDGELRSGIEGQSEGRFQRSAICGIAENESILLLFLNKKKFLYLPKTLLAVEALDEVRAWLQLPGAPPPC